METGSAQMILLIAGIEDLSMEAVERQPLDEAWIDRLVEIVRTNTDCPVSSIDWLFPDISF